MNDLGFVHYRLIDNNLQLYHRGTTFFSILWKTHPFIGVEFKPIAIGLMYFTLKWNRVSPYIMRFSFSMTKITIIKLFVRPFGLTVEKSDDASIWPCMNIFVRQNGRANLLKCSLIRFQVCILFTFGYPKLGLGNFTLPSGSNIVTTSQHKIRFATVKQEFFNHL